ncbi:hypothetical protein ACQKWADRAFT_319580 [Trichoderma austrokoningii]
MPNSSFVVGVGMTPFLSPKKSANLAASPQSDYLDLAVEACVKALLDAGLTFDKVDQGIGCYVFGDSTCAQRVFYSLGMTGIPILNVHNYCSSGSTGLWLANQAIRSGDADCVLVAGFDKMYPGVLPQTHKDRTNPLSRVLDLSKTQIPESERGKPSPGWSPQLYGNAQAEYLERYGGPGGAEKRDFAQITAVNREHGTRNPYSQLSKAVSAEDVLSSPVIAGDITRLQCCPSSTGAAAAVIVSESFLAAHPYLRSTAIQIASQSLATDSSKLYESKSAIELIGSDMTRIAAKRAYEQAGITPKDVSVIELHDCFTTNEMCALEGLGLAEEGKGWKLVRDGLITYNPTKKGKGWIVNPSGGLISKGHPLGATGLAQCAELVWHLRGWAKRRSVASTRYCLQHNMGMGGATVVTIYKRLDGEVAPSIEDTRPEEDGRSRLGYNPAEEARSISREDWESVLAGERIVRRQSIALGRSGPRSKNGCSTCRLRRVRCDERRPTCGHCDRLKLECNYQPPRPRRSQRRPPSPEDSSVSSRQDAEADADSSMDTSRRFSMVTDENNESSSSFSGLTSYQPSDALQEAQTTLSTGINGQYGASSADANANGLITDTMAPYMTPTAAAIDLGSTPIPPDFTGHLSQSPWSPSWLDRVPLPDSAFSFTSLGFTSALSPNFFNSDQPSSWPHVDGNAFTTSNVDNSPSIQSVANDSQLVNITSTGQINSTGYKPAFAFSPPLLSDSQQELLLRTFECAIQPPASLAGIHPLGWPKIKQYVLHMANGKHNSIEYGAVMHALAALSAMLFEPSRPAALAALGSRVSTCRDDFGLLSLRLHDVACVALKLSLSHAGWEERSSRALLVVIFLLAWFETAYDGNDQVHPSFPEDMAEQVIVNGHGWDAGSASLFQWLDSFDAKMSHMGGRHLLSDPALEIIRKPHPTVAGSASMEVSDSDSLSNIDGMSPIAMATDERSMDTTTKPRNGGSRLATLLTEPPTIPKNVVCMGVFNILLQPAFEFHMASQAYSRRVGCHDRHHRSRGTPEDEMEVMKACMGFEEELQELWRRRPNILDLDASQLRLFVSENIARRLEQLFSVYIATFWAHFIYIHRVAYWTLQHTAIARKALKETGNMMRRSVGQHIHEHAFDASVSRTTSTAIHPGLMWVCFLFGCEVSDPVQQEWAVLQLRALGRLSGTTGQRPASAFDSGEGDGLPVGGLDQKGAQTALKVARLLEVIIERQTKLGARVDGKYLSQEIFGCHFYII